MLTLADKGGTGDRQTLTALTEMQLQKYIHQRRLGSLDILYFCKKN